MRIRGLALAAALGLVGCSQQSSPPVRVALAGHSSPAGSGAFAPWPQASHDGRRSGSSSAVGPQSGQLRWTRQLEGNVTPGPVIGPGGTIYAASNAGVLHAIDPVSGLDRWRFDAGSGYGSDLSTSPAVLTDGSVLWPGPGGLRALSSNGALRWRLDLAGQPTSPAVGDGLVVVGTTAGHVYGVAPVGTVAWDIGLGGTSYGSVALPPGRPGRVYQTVDHFLVALDTSPTTAREAWRADLGSLVEVSPAVGLGGTIVVGGNAPYERGFSPDGKELWRFDRRAETYSSPVITDDGLAYFGDHHGVLSAVDIKSGQLAARYPGPTQRPSDNRSIGIWTSPVVDTRHDVYWGTRSGHVRGVTRAGRVLFDLAVGATVDSYPALDEGLLVVGLTDGRLLGIGQ